MTIDPQTPRATAGGANQFPDGYANILILLSAGEVDSISKSMLDPSPPNR